MQEVKMTIPYFGYKMVERKKVAKRIDALRILTPKRQNKTSYATIQDDNIILTSHLFYCPVCGKETPLYIHHSNKAIRTKDEVEKWSQGQENIFETTSNRMQFNSLFLGTGQLKCRKCGNYSKQSNGEFESIIRTYDEKLKILLKLDINSVLDMKWIDDLQITDTQLYETVTFDFKNGKAFLSLENREGDVIKDEDISDTDISFLYGDPICDILKYKSVYRKVQRYFKEIHDGSLPFQPFETDLGKYILLTEFIGFDRDFYNAIPFYKDKSFIHGSFKDMAKKLHRAKNVPDILSGSSLPDIKSIRKIIFSNPALLFYVDVLEKMWDIMPDFNYFCQFLNCPNIYYVLMNLYRTPCVFDFYKELISALKFNNACKIIINSSDEGFFKYAIEYMELCDYEKEEGKKHWSSKFFSKGNYFDKKEFAVSVPVKEVKKDSDNMECTINGYCFIRLKNSKDYIRAGNELNNCLNNWEMFKGNVFGILKNGKYTAAVEVIEKVIYQARGKHNCLIEKCTKDLYSAFEIWKDRYKLKFYEGTELYG